MKALLIHLVEVVKYVSNVTLYGIRLQSADLLLDWMFGFAHKLPVRLHD